MTSKSQQQDEMVNTFVASIPTMQTDIALLKQDTAFLKVASNSQSGKSDAILESLGKLSVVSKADFDSYKEKEEKWKEEFEKAIDKRFKVTENYLSEAKPGITFANALVNRWTTFLILLVLTSAVVAIVGKYMPIGG